MFSLRQQYLEGSKPEGTSGEVLPTFFPPHSPVQVAQRTFSKTGFKARGDTSSWTDTPEQAATKQAAGGSFLGGGGPAVLALRGASRGG